MLFPLCSFQPHEIVWQKLDSGSTNIPFAIELPVPPVRKADLHRFIAKIEQSKEELTVQLPADAQYRIAAGVKGADTLGTWDPRKMRFEKFHDRAKLLDLGKGVFTGPSDFVTPDGRTVVFTIAQGKRSFQVECHAGWAHNGGLSVELSIRKGQLHIQPIREIHSLRKGQLLSLSTRDTAEINQKLAQYKGDQLCLEYIAEQHSASVTLCYGAHRREVYYDRTARHLGIRDENGQEIGRWRGEIDNVDIGDEPIAFTCYLDHSMLEIYLNGRKSVTLRNYTEEYRCFRISGNPKSIALWEMASACQNHEVGSK